MGGFRFRHWLAALAAAFATPAFAAEPPPLAAYGELPSVERIALSPSGERIAVLSTLNGKRMLLMFDSKMELLRAYETYDTKIRGFEWAGEDTVLLVLSQTVDLPYGFTADQLEMYSAITIPTAKDEKTKVVFGEQMSILDVIYSSFGLRQVDGKWTAFLSGLQLTSQGKFLHGRPTLYTVDVGTAKGDLLAAPAPEGASRDWLIDDKGKVAATFQMVGRTGRWQIENGNRKIIASGVDQEGDAGLVSLGRNGDTVIYSEQNQEDLAQHWFEVPLDGSAPPTELFADKDVMDIYVDRETGFLLGYLEGGAAARPVLFDPDKQAAANAVWKAFAAYNLRMVDWTPDFSHILVHTSGNGNSGLWFLVDIGKLSANDIGIDRPAIRQDAVGPISRVDYKAADGLEMDGILTLPPGREAKNLPVILLPHGGPGSHDEVAFDWWAQAFASRGYAVFQPNFRGSTNRDDAFRRAGFGQWGRKMQTDISDGLAELAKRGIVDPKRACIMGASYGGYAALAGVTLQQGLYRCSVAVAPVSDLSLMYWADYRESGNSRMLRRSLEEELGPRSEFGNVSPRRFAARADAPILLIHGKDDTVVKFEQSEKMAAALKEAEKPYEMIVLEKEDHWLSRAETRKQMLEAAMAFVQKHNPAD